MKKVIKKVSLLLCLVLCLSFAVTYVVINNNDYVATANTNKCEVWGAPSTVKIRRDETDFNNKKPCALTYYAVKGEYESYQLMITAKQNINSYYLEIADLIDGNENVITKDNITVYNEYYTRVDFTSHLNAKVGGYYPDALVPIDLAKDAGELTIANGNNGALWITIKVPMDAVAGVYTSEFKLNVDGDVVKVPVSLNVYDYTLTEKSNFATIYNLWDAGLDNGEKDSTVEMKEKYYEFFLDYRINLDRLPIDSLDVDELVAKAKKYANDPRVTNYTIPYSTTGGCFYNEELFKNEIIALAKNSTPELNLLKKASLYFIDEPEGNGIVYEATIQGKDLHAMLASVVEEIIADVNNEFVELKKIDGWQSLITDMRNVMTSNFGTSEMYQLYNTWCPCWDKWYTASGIKDNEKIAEEMNKKIWWYGCMSPTEPYPQYHIDGTLLSSRAVNWLAQCYNIEGNLYWGVAAIQNTDLYDKAMFDDTNDIAGDGYLCYPGFKYGYHAPLPSIRLMSIRDGYEEYELLYALQKNCENVYQDVDAKEAIHNIYSSIHENIKTTTDLDLFEAVRLELLANAEMLKDNINFIVESFENNGNSTIVTMRLKESEYELKINGEIINAVNPNTFVYEFNNAEDTGFAVTITNKTNPSEFVEFNKIIG